MWITHIITTGPSPERRTHSCRSNYFPPVARPRVFAAGLARSARVICLIKLERHSTARPTMFLIYSLLFSLGVILTAPYYLWRARGSALRRGGWRERFGLLPTTFQQNQSEAVWVHAVSVGETLAIVRLVQILRKEFPTRPIFLSHVTPTGRATGEARLPGVSGQFYLPLDWGWSVRRGRIAPDIPAFPPSSCARR